MLEVKNIKKSFGQINAVCGISFKVKKGEILGFLGPNGAGKSTSMRVITGFLPPNEGTAVICGHDILAEPVLAKKCIGYLPENAPVYSDMTVTDFLKFIAGIRGYRRSVCDEKVESAIKQCSLENVRYQTLGTLSKGYKQRACFAQAIIHDPPVLIMDEPTDGLDPNQKYEVRNMIRKMAKDKAIVISTHILEEVDAVCTNTIIINNGIIVAHGTPDELKAQDDSGRLDVVFRKLTMENEADPSRDDKGGRK